MDQVMGQQQMRHAAPRRSAFEVRMDILKVVTNGCTRPTQMMYRSNTSWIILHKNLESLIAAGFMLQSVDSSGTVYAVTDRGISVMHDYQNLVHLASA
jgi:predicted transcriptional regulator